MDFISRMPNMLKSVLIGLALAFASSGAYAQCSGQPASATVCGNPTAGVTLPSWATQTALLDRAFGITQGTILNRGASVWAETSSPSLGKNGGAGGAVILNGATSGSSTLGVKAAAGSSIFTLPVGNGSLNNVLITDGAGNTSWTSAGSGTVSSVGLALPTALFTVTNSPVTSTGTLTSTLTTQTANTVWAGPTTGSAAQPTFRALVGADLPNPSASSLGGVQSAASVSHQWINSILTSGIPALSQPAFSDISGSITPAQCPNPSASTTGCIESLVATVHQWINTISTSGVPSSTQPNFTDIAGNATLAQLPSISNLSVLGNNSGGTAVPSTLSASNVLDFIGATQGNILYRSASGWTALAPGTNGQVLATGGASANPAWQTISGTGTVTSIATNNGITGGTITATGTIGLATIATGNALAYTGTGSGVPVATAPTTLLDVIGSSTGNLLYRSSGGWTVLAPGTNGQVLTQGASTPAWGNAGTLTNVTIAAGAGISTSGTCNISTSGTCTIAAAVSLNGNNIVRNSGLGLTTQVSTVLVNYATGRVAITGWAQQGGAGSGNVRFTTSGGNAGLQPGKLVAILGVGVSTIGPFTATVTGGTTITSTTSVLAGFAQGDLVCITAGTNTSPRTCYRVTGTSSGTVVSVNGGLVNQASVTFTIVGQQGGYPAVVDATVDGIPQAGNPSAPAFYYYPLQVTAVGTNFFDAQMAGHNINVGTTQTASAYEITNGSQNTNCFAPDWWSCTSTVSYYKMRGTDWDGVTVVNAPGSLYSAKLVKGAATQEFFWQDLAAAAPAAVNITNYAGIANFQGKTLTCGSYIKTPNASQGRIFIYDGSTRTYSNFVTAGSLQWVEVTATLSTTATAAQKGFSLDAGSIGDTFIYTQPICKFGNGVVGTGNYLPAPPQYHMFINHTNPFYYIGVSVNADTEIYIEQESSGTLPTGFESVQADIGGINTSGAGLIFLEDSGGAPQMSACASPNPSTSAGFQGNQTCTVGITKVGSGDSGVFILDAQHIHVTNSGWTDVTVDYLGGVY